MTHTVGEFVLVVTYLLGHLTSSFPNLLIYLTSEGCPTQSFFFLYIENNRAKWLLLLRLGTEVTILRAVKDKEEDKNQNEKQK
jgi:hypothetical protein